MGGARREEVPQQGGAVRVVTRSRVRRVDVLERHRAVTPKAMVNIANLGKTDTEDLVRNRLPVNLSPNHDVPSS